MRTIERSNQFKRDYKRELKGQRGKKLPRALVDLLDLLVNDKPLDVKYRDHGLSSAWGGYRDCHVWPDLVLIYSLPDAKTIRLARLESGR